MAIDDSIRANLTAAMRARHGADAPTPSVAGGGDGPHDPGMDARVTALEGDMKDVKASLQRLELGQVRMETVLATLATKADVVAVEGKLGALTEKVVALDGRLGRVEANVGTALTTAVGKAIGPVQFVAMLASSLALFGAAVTAYAWLVHQPWFPH